MHRDLKPENVLLSETGHIKLTDFGTSKVVGVARDARSNSFVGTAEYIGPELLQGDNKVAYKSMDLWSLGCMVFQMICGRPPFRGATEYVTFQKVSAGKVIFPTNMPEVAKDLIKRLCVVDPFARLGADNFAELKAHSFFTNINWNTILESTPIQQPYTEKLIWEEDVIKEEEERQRQVREAERKEWASFLLDTEKILVSGLIYKRRKLSIKKRFMILTDTPRLIYIDPKARELKGEVPWSRKLTVEVKNDVTWRVNTVRNAILRQYRMRQSRSPALGSTALTLPYHGLSNPS
jgi:3-phosphoinositide dependent protein kinase-1